MEEETKKLLKQICQGLPDVCIKADSFKKGVVFTVTGVSNVSKTSNLFTVHCKSGDSEYTLPSNLCKVVAWSKEDTTMVKTLLNLVEIYYEGCVNESEKNLLLNWLKSLKSRIKAKSMLKTSASHNPKSRIKNYRWTEDDEVIWTKVVDRAEFALWFLYLPYDDTSPIITWLKFVKQRLKM